MISPPAGTWEFDGRTELADFLEKTDLTKADICLVGSLSLAARGLRSHADIDVCVHPDKRSHVAQQQPGGIVGLTEDRYTCIDLSDREIIENDNYHDVIDGWMVIRPEISFSYKKLRDLPKDERDVALLTHYAEETADWDWSLYRSDYREPPSSLPARGWQSLRSDGILITVDKLLGLLHRKSPFVRQVANQNPLYDLPTVWDAATGGTRTVHGAALLTRQLADRECVSMDTVAACAALRADRTDTVVPFDRGALNLDSAWLATRLDSLRPIRVSRKHHVIDPVVCASHLLADTDSVTIAPTVESRERRGRAWLREQSLSDEACEFLKRMLGELLEEVGAMFYAILWPPAHEYFDEIERLLARKVWVYESEDRRIDDISSFVKDIYDAQAHPVPKWSIDWKAERMQSFPSTVRVVKLILPNPRLRDGVSGEMEMVKNDVRHHVVGHFPDEYYLSLLHATDNFADNQAVRTVLATHQ